MKYNWVAPVISLVLLLYLFWYSNIFQIVKLFLKANPLFVLIGFSIWFVDAIVRGLRWKYLLNKSGIRIKLKDTLHVYIPGLFLSNISPAKVGDVMRSVLLKGMKRKSVSKSLPSIFVERLFDLIILIIISIAGVAMLVRSLVLPLVLSILIYSVVFALGVIILISPRRTKVFISKLVSIFWFINFIKKIKPKLYSFSKSMSRSFRKYKNPKTLFTGLVYTGIVWIIEGIILFVSFKTIGINLSLELTTFVVAVSVLFGVISFLPGGLGVNEAVTLIILSQYKLTAAEIMTGMIFSRLYGYWVYVLFGSLILATGKYKFS